MALSQSGAHKFRYPSSNFLVVFFSLSLASNISPIPYISPFILLHILQWRSERSTVTPYVSLLSLAFCLAFRPVDFLQIESQLY